MVYRRSPTPWLVEAVEMLEFLCGGLMRGVNRGRPLALSTGASAAARSASSLACVLRPCSVSLRTRQHSASLAATEHRCAGL